MIDFSWYAFIGRTRLGLTFRETGRLTLNAFCRLYGHYKDTFDREMLFARGGVTYARAARDARKSEEWL